MPKSCALPRTDWWWQAVALLFDPKLMVVWDLVLAAFLLMAGRLYRACWVLVSLGSLDAFGILIKHLVRRQRPSTEAHQRPHYSFPSGHTLGATMMALMMGLLFSSPLVHWLVFLLWLLIITSRLTLRAHYPTDVLGAILLAYGWFIGTELLYILIMR